MANIYYVDGKYVPADQAVIPVDDLAIIRGIGVFDLLRTHNGRPYFLKEHVDRLFNSARKIRLVIPWSQKEICNVVVETLNRNTVDEANIRIIVTGGSSPDFITPKGKPRLIVLISPLPKLPDWWRTQGIKVITIKVHRSFPGAKSIDYLPAAVALREAQSENAIEAIYLDDNDNAQEGTTSNLFIFSQGKLVTPGSGVLPGITRQVVLHLACDRHPVEIRDIPKRELLAAQEVFITGTNKGLVPVVRIDNAVISDGRPGPLTRQMISMLDQHTEQITR